MSATKPFIVYINGHRLKMEVFNITFKPCWYSPWRSLEDMYRRASNVVFEFSDRKELEIPALFFKKELGKILFFNTLPDDPGDAMSLLEISGLVE